MFVWIYTYMDLDIRLPYVCMDLTNWASDTAGECSKSEEPVGACVSSVVCVIVVFFCDAHIPTLYSRTSHVWCILWLCFLVPNVVCVLILLSCDARIPTLHPRTSHVCCILWLCFLVPNVVCVMVVFSGGVEGCVNLYEHHYHSQVVWFVWASLSLTTCLICMSITITDNLFDLYEHHFFS